MFDRSIFPAPAGIRDHRDLKTQTSRLEGSLNLCRVACVTNNWNFLRYVRIFVTTNLARDFHRFIEACRVLGEQ